MEKPPREGNRFALLAAITVICPWSTYWSVSNNIRSLNPILHVHPCCHTDRKTALQTGVCIERWFLLQILNLVASAVFALPLRARCGTGGGGGEGDNSRETWRDAKWESELMRHGISDRSCMSFCLVFFFAAACLLNNIGCLLNNIGDLTVIIMSVRELKREAEH